MKKKTGQFEQQNTQRARDFSVVCTFVTRFLVDFDPQRGGKSKGLYM